jgi:hypothetical protein
MLHSYETHERVISIESKLDQHMHAVVCTIIHNKVTDDKVVITRIHANTHLQTRVKFANVRRTCFLLHQTAETALLRFVSLRGIFSLDMCIFHAVHNKLLVLECVLKYNLSYYARYINI